MIPILADAQFKLDPTVRERKGVQYLHCGHCGCELNYKTDESCSLFSYVVYECPRCNRQFNNAKRYPRKVQG